MWKTVKIVRSKNAVKLDIFGVDVPVAAIKIDDDISDREGGERFGHSVSPVFDIGF